MDIEDFLQKISKLLQKNVPYIMPKSYSSFSSKPWMTTAIANSIKSKNKIFEKFCEEKNPQQKEIYGKQFKTYRNLLITLLRITVWKTIKEIITTTT